VVAEAVCRDEVDREDSSRSAFTFIPPIVGIDEKTSWGKKEVVDVPVTREMVSFLTDQSLGQSLVEWPAGVAGEVFSSAYSSGRGRSA
jgi:hypothetical protein